jgi:hypothetical protein
MADKETPVRDVPGERFFAIGHLLRTFRMAFWPPAKLLLCLAAIALTVGAGALLDQAFKTSVYNQSYLNNMVDVYRAATGYRLDPSEIYFSRTPPENVWTVEQFCSLHGFWYGPLEATRHMARLTVEYWKAAPWFAVVNMLIALLVWTFFGGAVCRIAALQFARDERTGMGAALKYACRKYASLVASPLALFLVVAIFALAVALPASLVLLIPYAGEIVIGLATIFLVLLGAVLALLSIFGLASLGLQLPAIGADGRDAFDAVSRSVDYVVNRPWRYGFYSVFSLVYLCFTFVLVRFFIFLTLKIPHAAMTLWPWSHTSGASGQPTGLERIWIAPTVYQLFQWPAGAEGVTHVSAVLVAIVVIFFLGLMVSFLPSFFFTSQTIIYFLLRREVDFKDLDDLQVEEKSDGIARLEKVEQAVLEPEPPVDEKKDETAE